ncbi:MAG: N-methyl-L-tryptophan oxidase [Rubrivivax sp.]
MTARYDVAIVGLGAMGSATAFHLARCGQRVLGLERFGAAHALGSSQGRSRIIRQAYFEHPLYVPLVQRAQLLWRQLELQSGRSLLRTTGALMIGRPDSVLVEGALRSAREHRLQHALLTAAEVHSRFPALHPTADQVALWEADAGVLDPQACIEAHLQLAASHGAALRFDEALSAWQADGDGVRLHTTQGEYRADQLLFCAGAWMPSLLPELDLRLSVERQVTYWFTPQEPALFTPAACPVHMWQLASGEFFYGLPDSGDGVKVGLHHGGEITQAETLRRDVGDDEVAAMRALLRRLMPLADAQPHEATVCMYTNTPDEHFLIDRHPAHAQVLIASACSGHGFKFSSCLGELLAQQLTGHAAQAPAFDLSVFARR